MSLKSILCNSIFNLLIFMFSTFLVFKAMFGFSEKIIKKSFIDEKFLVKKSPVGLLSGRLPFPYTLCLFTQNTPSALYWPPVREPQSADKTLSVIYHLAILSGLKKCKVSFSFFCHQTFCFSVLKEDIPVVQRILTFLENLKCQAENIHFSSLTKIIQL